MNAPEPTDARAGRTSLKGRSDDVQRAMATTKPARTIPPRIAESEYQKILLSSLRDLIAFDAGEDVVEVGQNFARSKVGLSVVTV